MSTLEQINFKHRRIFIQLNQEQVTQKAKLFKSIFAYLEQQELLALISRLNYDSNTAGILSSIQLDCHPEVVLALRNYIKSYSGFSGIDIAHHSETEVDDF